MQTDSNLIFVGNTNLSSITIGSASVTSCILDLASGLLTSTSSPTTYIAPVVSGGQFLLNSSLLFGEDLGPGAIRLRGAAWLTSAFAPNSTSGTNLQVLWQGAVDASSGTYPANFSGLTWNTFAAGGVIPLADLSTSTAIALPDFPDRIPKTGLPRFIRLAFQPSGTFSSLTIVFAGLEIGGRPDFNIGQYPGGFQVAS